MATFNTSIIVTAVDQATGVLGSIASKFQGVARSIESNARSIARSTQAAAVAAATSAAQAVSAPLSNFGRDLLRNETEWSRVQNRIAVATDNFRDLENRSGMRSEAVQAARHAANVRRQNESLALIQRVAKETIYNATQVGEAFAELNFAGVPEAAARAILPLVAMYGQAADLGMAEAGTSMPRMVGGAFGRGAIQDAGRFADLGRFSASTVVAAANVSGANVKELDAAVRVAAPLVMGPERRRLEREAEANPALADAGARIAHVEAQLKQRFTTMVAQLATMIQAGAQGAEAGRSLAATETRLGALPEKASRVLRTAGIDTMQFQTMAPDSAARVVGHVERNLPNVSAVARRQIAQVYSDETLSAAERFQQSSRILATRGGINGAALSVQDAVKAARVLREGHDATVAATDVNGIISELERRGVNPGVFKQAIGQYHAPRIGNLEGPEVERIRRETEERAARNGFLEQISEQQMAGLYGAWHKLTGAIDNAKKAIWSTFGEDFISLVKSAESAIERVTDVLTARDKDTGEYVNKGLRDIVKWSAIAAGALLVITPILVTIGIAGLGMMAVAKTFGAIAATAATVVKVVGAVAGAVLSVKAAVVIAAAALAGWAIWSDLGGSLAPFLSAVEQVKAAFRSLWGAAEAAMSGDWSKAGELAMSALRSIGGALWSLGESLGKAALGALSAAWDGITAWARDVWQSMQNLGRNIYADAVVWGRDIAKGIQEGFDGAVTGIRTAFGNLWTSFDSAVIQPIRNAWSELMGWLARQIDRALAPLNAARRALGMEPISVAPQAEQPRPVVPQVAVPTLPQTPQVQVPPSLPAPSVPAAPSVPQSMMGLVLPAPDVKPITDASKAVEGAARDAAGPAGSLATEAGKIASQAAAAASNLDAISRSLSGLSGMRITLPQVTAPSAPAAPAAPAAMPGQQSGDVQPFRSFADQGVQPGGAMSRTASFDGQLDIRVRSDRGSEVRAAMQSRGDVRTKLDAGMNDAAWA